MIFSKHRTKGKEESLSLRLDANKRTPVVTPKAEAVSAWGIHGFGGGAWDQMPTPRRWLETNRDAAGMYPFITGTASPTNGAPIGYNILTGAGVAMDHLSLYKSNAITSPSAMVFGLNGYGKSSLSGLVAAAVNATGTPLAIFDPIKGEWADFARAIGADVFQVGIRPGSTKINPLDPGPLAVAGDYIGGALGTELKENAFANVSHNVVALVRINRGRDRSISDAESAMIKIAVEAVMRGQQRPELMHILHFLKDPTREALDAAGVETAESFRVAYQDLYRSISALALGEMSQVFGVDGVSINPGNPGGFCFDSSSIPVSLEKMISAVMISTWRLGMNAIDAHWELAEFEKRKQAEAAAEGEVYVPKYTWRGYSSLMDEFWYPVRMAEGMVQEVDRLSRTNRSVGVGEWKITHSPKDFLMLANEADRKIAHSLIEKCGLWVLMAMTQADLDALSTIRHIEPTEASIVTGFMSGAQGLEQAAEFKGMDGSVYKSGKHTLPGAGKALWKVGDSLGIPVQSPKPATLGRLHDTDTRFDKNS